MNIPSILGAVGTLVGLIRAMPQLVRLLRAREAFGVSVDTAGTSSIVSFGWAAYGILTSQPYVSFATGSSGVIFAFITFAALRFGRSIREFRVTPVWFVVLLVVGLLAGKTGLGIVLSISVLAANIPQLWVAFKEGNLADLSLETWTLSILDGLVWGAYALFQRDISIMAYGLFQLTTSGLIVALKLAYRTRQSSENKP
ncbi:MAG: hypothetical protein HN413_00365 [Chloroflexi bacterium]|nr:hypothetical protein [Chloroflexota bacterium]